MKKLITLLGVLTFMAAAVTGCLNGCKNSSSKGDLSDGLSDKGTNSGESKYAFSSANAGLATSSATDAAPPEEKCMVTPLLKDVSDYNEVANAIQKVLKSPDNYCDSDPIKKATDAKGLLNKIYAFTLYKKDAIRDVKDLTGKVIEINLKRPGQSVSFFRQNCGLASNKPAIFSWGDGKEPKRDAPWQELPFTSCGGIQIRSDKMVEVVLSDKKNKTKTIPFRPAYHN